MLAVPAAQDGTVESPSSDGNDTGEPPTASRPSERSAHGGEGLEPDPRWSLANERTLLAYQRTALGLAVAGLAIAGSHSVSDAPAGLAAVGLPLIALSVAFAVAGRQRFITAQRAMRTGAPLPAATAATTLPWALAAVAALAFVLAAIQLL